ncbi:unnamed protein product [Paramecium pentaurelia]|uniref:Uncharacterized protein n=1 Tax=Paramecium pentaurelia TaxID=43138 RepID=A0A8S1UFN1_9CILI|nr:unnamed protein product [Paramecium pentaurelia]
MSNSFSQEIQTSYQKTITTSQNVQRTTDVDFQDAVQRYELRRSSKPKKQIINQKTGIVGNQYMQISTDDNINNYNFQSSKHQQRIVQKYSNINSANEVNKYNVQEVKDEYERGKSLGQLSKTEKYNFAGPLTEYEEEFTQQKENVLNYNGIQTQQITYQIDYEQIKEDCQYKSQQYKSPQREDDEQIQLLDTDYVSCKIF